MKNGLIHSARCLCEEARHDTEHRAARQARKGRGSRFIGALVLACCVGFAGVPVNSATPTAKEILATARNQQAQQQIDLDGQLRQDAALIPFHLMEANGVTRYTFTSPDEALQLRLGENDSRLEEVSRDGVEKITPAQWDHKVRGTAVTYEDLALKFLYWPNPQITGEESIRTRACWKLEIHAPSRQSQYSSVSLWVDKGSGALMRLEGYNWEGKLAKRFEVVSAQKVEGRWILKQMRIEQIDPGSGKVTGRTYLEILK